MLHTLVSAHVRSSFTGHQFAALIAESIEQMFVVLALSQSPAQLPTRALCPSPHGEGLQHLETLLPDVVRVFESNSQEIGLCEAEIAPEKLPLDYVFAQPQQERGGGRREGEEGGWVGLGELGGG